MSPAKQCCNELVGLGLFCLFAVLCGALGVIGAVITTVALCVVFWSIVWAVKIGAAVLSRRRAVRNAGTLIGCDPVSLLAAEVRNIAAVVDALAALSTQQAPLLAEMHSAFRQAQQARQSR